MFSLPVGLPAGVMGNSEVGHQNIGAGRLVEQEIMRITGRIRDGAFFDNPALVGAFENAADTSGRLHIMGLCSDGRVHSDLDHLYGLLEMSRKVRFPAERVFIHAFTDGRDSPPDSGAGYIADIESKAAEIGVGKIASVMGRFYAMDRDSRWDRVQRAYECMRIGKGLKATSAAEAVAKSYEKDVTDEFIEPTCVVNEDDEPIAAVSDGDGLFPPLGGVGDFAALQGLAHGLEDRALIGQIQADDGVGPELQRRQGDFVFATEEDEIGRELLTNLPEHAQIEVAPFQTADAGEVGKSSDDLEGNAGAKPGTVIDEQGDACGLGQMREIA